MVFGRALPLIDSALVWQYRLPQEVATEVEQCLREWFHGFARRPGSPKSGEALRPHLLLMACQAGHVYWAGELEEVTPADENVKRALTLGPHQIAIELEKTVKNREKADRKKDESDARGNGDEEKPWRAS